MRVAAGPDGPGQGDLLGRYPAESGIPDRPGEGARPVSARVGVGARTRARTRGRRFPATAQKGGRAARTALRVRGIDPSWAATSLPAWTKA